MKNPVAAGIVFIVVPLLLLLCILTFAAWSIEKEKKACRARGGIPVNTQGYVTCFAPGVLR